MLFLAVIIALVQFLINLIGQIWPPLEYLRPLTVFYYYQPQPIILGHGWQVGVRGAAVLLAVGAVGYALALWTFVRRDVPAPL